MTFQWTLPNVTPPRSRLQPYEWDVCLGLAGGMTFDEIADDTGLSHAEIREAIDVLGEHRRQCSLSLFIRRRLVPIDCLGAGNETLYACQRLLV